MVRKFCICEYTKLSTIIPAFWSYYAPQFCKEGNKYVFLKTNIEGYYVKKRLLISVFF